jgi:hypothetical protein
LIRREPDVPGSRTARSCNAAVRLRTARGRSRA